MQLDSAVIYSGSVSCWQCINQNKNSARPFSSRSLTL